jgi:hypothetical protein
MHSKCSVLLLNQERTQMSNRNQTQRGASVSSLLVRSTMALVGLAFIALFGGCATRPPVPMERSVASLVDWYNERPFIKMHSDPTPPLFSRASSLLQKCEADSGTLDVTPEDAVFRDRKPTGFTQKAMYMEFMLCHRAEKPVWAVAMSVTKTELQQGVTATGIDFFGEIRLRYFDAQQAVQEVATRAEAKARKEEKQWACVRKEIDLREQLRGHPQAGLVASVGTVVEVRMPMVLVQYNALERGRLKRDQEWVRAETLDVDRDCF